MDIRRKEFGFLGQADGFAGAHWMGAEVLKVSCWKSDTSAHSGGDGTAIDDRHRIVLRKSEPKQNCMTKAVAATFGRNRSRFRRSMDQLGRTGGPRADCARGES
jgi:hypothetical protein